MKSLEKMSFYELLNVAEDATQEEIQKAYLLAMATYRPNSLATYGMISGHERQVTLKKIEKAFQILSDRTRRQDYNRRFLEKRVRRGEALAEVPERERKPAEKPEKEETLWQKITSPVLSVWTRHSELEEQKSEVAEKRANKDLLIQEFSLSTGKYLKNVRDMKGLSLEIVSDRTKISVRYLRALEEDDYEILPGGAYLTYMLGAYAKSLSLDPQLVLKDFRLPPK